MKNENISKPIIYQALQRDKFFAKFLIIFLICNLQFVICDFSFAQKTQQTPLKEKAKAKTFEGVINYTISANEVGLTAENVAMIKGKTVQMYVKNQSVRTEMDLTMMKSVSITDVKNKTTNVLMEVMSQKYIIKKKIPTEIKGKIPSKYPRINYVEGDKQIAGYKCKRAMYFEKEHATPTEIYYTEEIPANSFFHQFKNLKGFPLQYTTVENDLQMTLTAKSVKVDMLQDAMFILPPNIAEYKETTNDDLQKMFRGGH